MGAVNEFYRLKKDLCLESRESGMGNDKLLERWIKPEEGWLKVKCDGALDLKTKIAGSGVIVRDWNETVVDGICRKRLADSALMTKTLALKDGFGLVWLLRKMVESCIGN